MKKQKFSPYSLLGKDINSDDVFPVIYNDIDNSPYGNFYWLPVRTMVENVCHYIRFPHGPEFSFEYNDNGIITKVY